MLVCVYACMCVCVCILDGGWRGGFWDALCWAVNEKSPGMKPTLRSCFRDLRVCVFGVVSSFTAAYVGRCAHVIYRHVAWMPRIHMHALKHPVSHTQALLSNYAY